MSLPSLSQPSRRHSSSQQPCGALRPDPAALLLAAVERRQAQRTLELVQRWVHRSGVGPLQLFQATTLPDLAGAEASAWFDATLADGVVARSPSLAAPRAEPDPVEPDRVAMTPVAINPVEIEQRALAEVDAAIAAMVAEFPELGALPQPLASEWALQPPPPIPIETAQSPLRAASDAGPGGSPEPTPGWAQVAANPALPSSDQLAGLAPVSSGLEWPQPGRDPAVAEQQNLAGPAWQDLETRGFAGLGAQLRRRLPLGRWKAQVRRCLDLGAGERLAETAQLAAIVEAAGILDAAEILDAGTGAEASVTRQAESLAMDHLAMDQLAIDHLATDHLAVLQSGSAAADWPELDCSGRDWPDSISQDSISQDSTRQDSISQQSAWQAAVLPDSGRQNFVAQHGVSQPSTWQHSALQAAAAPAPAAATSAAPAPAALADLRAWLPDSGSPKAR